MMTLNRIETNIRSVEINLTFLFNFVIVVAK
jgi:hypothetical protein